MAPLSSWLLIPTESDFSLSNIPFGIITSKSNPTTKRPAIAIGTQALDLQAFASSNGFSALPSVHPHLSVFAQPTLNAFAALGQPIHREVRTYIQDILSSSTSHPEILQDNEELQKKVLIPQHEFKNHLPMQIGDYTDFYAGKNHAYNAGCLFRDPKNALQPNYYHLPVGYHGRASSIVVSGTPIRRPSGQINMDPTAEVKVPTFSACKRLDIELELGCFICKENELGEPVKVDEAKDHIFGYVLLNDWSARDIQNWEYVPLGPFNGKNFGSTISPWVVLPCALELFRTEKLENKTKLLSYLEEKEEKSVFDIQLEIDLMTPEGDSTTLSQVSGKNLIWSFEQMIAHHTIGGCNMRVGDLLGSGTISGKSEKGDDLGSLLEMSQAGKKEIMLAGMDVRKFLKDGDTVTIRGSCGGEGERVGFGECRGKIESALRF